MESQSQIKRCLSEASAITQVCGILHQDEVTHRTDLARRLCSHYGFFNAQGQAQIAGCLKPLGELSNAGHFTLPAARSRPRRIRPVAGDSSAVTGAGTGDGWRGARPQAGVG